MMEQSDVEQVPQVESRWHKLLTFPLVAMLVAIATFVLAAGMTSFVMRVLPMERGDARSLLGASLAVGLVLTGYKLVIRHLGEEPRDDLAAHNAGRDLGLGLVGGFILFSLIVGIAALADVYNIVGEGGTATLAATLVSVAIVPGFIEEVLFRGILFRFLEQFGGSWFALALTSALFGLGHIVNPNASAFSSFAIAVEAGVLLGGAYMLTRSLWAPIGLHAAWNFTQGYVYDVPVSGIDQQGMVEAQLSGPELLSGGLFGLEASIIALLCATAAGTWLVVRAVRAGHLVRPWWVRRRLAAELARQPEQLAG
jgi:membrane protease YdiL (CAAX protease family)